MEFAIVLIILSIAAIATSIRIVKQQTLAIVEVFGKYSSTLEPGLQFVLPFGMALIAKEISLKVFEISSHVEIKTKDNQFVLMPTSIMYQVIPDMAAEAYYKLEDAPSQIQSWVLNSIKAKASAMNLEELFTDRETLENKAKEDLDAKFQDYGYQIISVLVSQPTLSPDVQTSFNKVVASVRDKEAAKNEAEASRIKTVAQAEAEAEAQTARAKGLSEARRILAEGLEASIKKIQESGVSTETAMYMLIETNKLDTLKDIGKHGNLVIADINAQSTVNAVESIKQLKKV